MSSALPECDVVNLPKAKVASLPPHVFGEAVTIPSSKSLSTFEQREWTCKTCGVIRVTVLTLNGAVRKWRLPENDVQLAWMPPCGPKIGVC